MKAGPGLAPRLLRIVVPGGVLPAALLLAGLVSLWAETQYLDVVYLKDGAVHQGFVVEEKPGESMRVETTEGHQLTFMAGEVERIEVKYLDVLFLQSGVVFRGMIISQTPEESLTMETSGGARLTFPVEEVWKLVKEKTVVGEGEGRADEQEESREVRSVKLELQIDIARGKAASLEGRGNRRRTEKGEAEQQRLGNEIARLKEEMASLEEEQRREEALSAEATEGELLETLEQVSGIIEKCASRSMGSSLESGEAAVEEADSGQTPHPYGPTQLLLRARSIASGMKDLVAVISEESESVQAEYAEEQRRKTEELEGRKDVVAARADVQDLLESGDWKRPRYRDEVEEMIDLLPPLDRRFLYDAHRRDDQLKGLGMNLVPVLSLGSWLQGDVLGALATNALSVAGIMLVALGGLEQRIGVGPNGPYGYYWPNVRGLVGVGLVAGGYALSFLEPFRFVRQRNRSLADTLRVSQRLAEGG